MPPSPRNLSARAPQGDRHNSGTSLVGGPAGGSAARSVEDALDETVGLFGYGIVLAEWAGKPGHGRILRIYLDHPQGISLDDCAKMSRIIGDALDAAEAEPTQGELAALLAAPYTLEVSSPGIERPLVRRSHFARFIGQPVVIRTEFPLDAETNQRTFHGVLTAAEEDPAHPGDDRQGFVGVREGDPDTGVERRLPLAAIRRANLVFEV